MICGVVLLDKPEGISSNAALQRVKRATRAGKAGHTGSLDPLATGMLPVCLGEATKIAGDLLGGRKRYRFEVALGARTDTGDREGRVVETLPVPALDEAAVEAVLTRFRGPQSQVPPMYSALKRDGRPLYRLARAGIEVERAARTIEVEELSAVERRADSLELEALCSKGTYIRVLAEDIARALGSCGHVARLRRLWVAPFEREPMQTLEAIEADCGAGRPPRLIAADRALPMLAAVVVPQSAAVRLGQGQSIESPQPDLHGRVRLYEEGGRFLGLGEADGRGALRPRRLFVLVAGGGSE
ncbi:MAG: tRNA pseudouridine(55) synthase TruB [Steroidobacteraceae bacterium]